MEFVRFDIFTRERDDESVRNPKVFNETLSNSKNGGRFSTLSLSSSRETQLFDACRSNLISFFSKELTRFRDFQFFFSIQFLSCRRYTPPASRNVWSFFFKYHHLVGFGDRTSRLDEIVWIKNRFYSTSGAAPNLSLSCARRLIWFAWIIEYWKARALFAEMSMNVFRFYFFFIEDFHASALQLLDNVG